MKPFKNLTKTISNSNQTDEPPWHQWSYNDWARWLDEKLEEREKVFLSDPDELIASFNSEKSHASGYHGRELVELIQNADDSGIDYSGPNRLLIKLTEFGLFVANTGVPFSDEGVKSLMVRDYSPKQLLRTKCIGYKGLGFRSILGWTSSIVILSGNLSIGFNEKLAINWLQDLRKHSHKVDGKVKKYEDLGYPTPIATLSIPYLISAENMQQNGVINSIYEEGVKILENGYDTVVCLLFKNAEKTREQVQRQINSLGSEIVLFLQFLEKVEIQSKERNECWIVERKENEIVVNPYTNTPRIWKIFKREDNIPEDYLRPEQILHDKYEIKLAVPAVPIDVNRLFVFFPTEVRFPFPVILHATFEVGDNRQHLIDSDVNRFIAKEVADLMAEAAEKIKEANNPWYALSTISPRGDIDPILEKFDFIGMLREKTKTYAIIPVRNNNFETAEKSKRIKGNFDNLLTGDLFQDLCIYVDDYFINRQLENLGISHIEYDDFRNRLNKISIELTLNQRMELVYLLVENNLIEGESPELLIDENNEKILSASPVFLAPEGKIFSLPAWVPQRILNSELISLLRAKFRVSRVRDLALKLEKFNVREYNLNALVSAIQAETNRRCKERPDEELLLRQQTIQAIWNLYSSSEEKVRLSDDITIILPTRSGGFDSAKNLYLGKEYSRGKILEYLYAHIDSGLFVADAEKLGFSGLSHEIEEFLCWLGVNNAPKYAELSFTHGDFLDCVMSCLKYPAKFEDITIVNVEELKDCHHSLEKVSTVDRLEEVLLTADPHAVICWVAISSEIESWRLNGDTGAIFKIRKPRQWGFRKLFNQVMPSYTLWLLRNVKWLPASSGNRLAPAKCSLARGARDLEPVIGYPAINMEHPLIKELNLDLTAIRNALIKIGVVTDLDELPWDSFYEVLLELPKLDPEGNKAKALYRILVGRSDVDISPCGEKYEEFMKKGKMLGRVKGELVYLPISKLFYLENITLPSNIAEQFPLLELDKRRGASKIKKLFGVEPLTRDKIQIEITHFEEHPASQSFQSEVDRLKPYIYALRVEEDTNRANLSALKRLKVELCKSVSVAVCVSGERREIDLSEGHAINIDTVAYLVSEPSDYSRSFLDDEIIADALGEIISNILRVDVNNEIARLASCSSSKRDLLLDRIVGGSGKERMGKSKELLKASGDKEEKEDQFSRPSPWTPPPKGDEKELPEEEPEEDLTKGETKPDDIGSVSTRDLGTPVPLPKKKIVARRIQGNPKGSRTPHFKKRVNPDRAENLALRFEESQGRYPVKVSHIRGLQAYGCDIVSFKSEEALASFKEKDNPDSVERFIEVKGSTSEKGSVILAGNELSSAQAYRERFFVYRVYEDEDTGLFELIALSDPLDSEKEAFEIHYEINPFRSSKSHLWEIEEIHNEVGANDENLNQHGEES
jgi:hypothetical protein